MPFSVLGKKKQNEMKTHHEAKSNQYASLPQVYEKTNLYNSFMPLNLWAVTVHPCESK